MKAPPRLPLQFWKFLHHVNKRMLTTYGPKSKAASRVLVLTTIGRKSGLPRSTPLQYEESEGVYYVASARGAQADWYRNLVKCPQVTVWVGEKHFTTLAELMIEPGKIADFLELRTKRHPGFMGAMLILEGLPRKYTRADLEKLAERLAVVALHPEKKEIAEIKA